MSLARLVVIEGPDAGREIELRMRGGKLGRGDDCEYKLTDPTVSRNHGSIEMRDGALTFVAEKRTLINGAEATLHRLESGDEIVIGATKLAYLPEEGVAITRQASNVTMEVSSRQLLALTGRDDRARRHLAAIAQLGDRLRGEAAAGRDAVARAACDAAKTALEAQRAFVLSAGKRPTPVAASIGSGESSQLQISGDLADKVTNQRQVVTGESGGRALIAAPVHGGADEVVAILWVDRKGAPYEEADSLAAGCIAHLTGAAWVGADTREQLSRRGDPLA